MQPVSITDPAWRTTFPLVVAPLAEEWLAGLLLRCDEVNRWDSGTTLPGSQAKKKVADLD